MRGGAGGFFDSAEPAAAAAVQPTAQDVARLLISLTYAQKGQLSTDPQKLHLQIMRQGAQSAGLLIMGNLSIVVSFPSMFKPTPAQEAQLDALRTVEGVTLIRHDGNMVARKQFSPRERNKAEQLVAKLLCILFKDSTLPLMILMNQTQLRVVRSETAPLENVLDLRQRSAVSETTVRTLLSAYLPCLCSGVENFTVLCDDAMTGSVVPPGAFSADQFDLIVKFHGQPRPDTEAIKAIALREGVDPSALVFSGARGEQLKARLPGQQDALRRFLLAVQLELVQRPFKIDFALSFLIQSLACGGAGATLLPAPARSIAIAEVARQMNVLPVKLALYLESFKK